MDRIKKIGATHMKHLQHVAPHTHIHTHTHTHTHTQQGTKAATGTTHALTYTSTTVTRRSSIHLDVINQCDWIAGVRLGLELQRKGPFWGWTDPNSLWQGSY